MKWLEAYFDESSLCPADFILSRHCEILAADPKLISIFGGSGRVGNRIQMVPLGKLLETATPPLLFATIPMFARFNAPGVFGEKIRVRDVVRFKPDGSPTGAGKAYTPSMATLASHIIRVVMKNQQLTYNTGSTTVPLASRCNVKEFYVEQVESGPSGTADNLFDMRVDFEYEAVVAKTSHRLYPLVTAE